MSATRQGMSSEEMERVVAQRVANAIEAIAIYETKIRIANDSIHEVVREEATIGKNVTNKRKRGSDHGRNSDQQQSRRIEVVRAHATRAGNKKATSVTATTKRALVANQKPGVTYFGYGAQGHFKSLDQESLEIVSSPAQKTIMEQMRRKIVMLKNMPTSGQSLNSVAIRKLITQRVTEAMAAYEANQNNQNGNGNPNVNVGGVVPVTLEYTYQDFMKCQTLNFNGTEGVVGLTRWFEKIETTWWNSHKRTIRTDAAYAMTWKELMKLITEVYCLRSEIQKMETELWNLSIKEEDQVEKFNGGLPDNIQGSVIAAEPIRLQDAIRIASNLMYQKLKGYIARNAENMRRFDNNPRDNCVQQPPFKRQNVEMAYTVRNNNKKGYAGILPLYNECTLHHHGPCPVKYGNSKTVGHQARDYWTPTSVTCFECGGKGNTKRYCPELGNVNRDGEDC
ncbi:hypothetical protein Tco_0371399 [Tanacetum coccineum]